MRDSANKVQTFPGLSDSLTMNLNFLFHPIQNEEGLMSQISPKTKYCKHINEVFKLGSEFSVSS